MFESVVNGIFVFFGYVENEGPEAVCICRLWFCLQMVAPRMAMMMPVVRFADFYG